MSTSAQDNHFEESCENAESIRPVLAANRAPSEQTFQMQEIRIVEL